MVVGVHLFWQTNMMLLEHYYLYHFQQRKDRKWWFIRLFRWSFVQLLPTSLDFCCSTGPVLAAVIWHHNETHTTETYDIECNNSRTVAVHSSWIWCSYTSIHKNSTLVHKPCILLLFSNYNIMKKLVYWFVVCQKINVCSAFFLTELRSLCLAVFCFTYFPVRR